MKYLNSGEICREMIMQHGDGKEHILTEEKFNLAIKRDGKRK